MAAPAHGMAMRTKDGCLDILPILAVAVMNPAAKIGPWQWAVVVAATVMEGGSGKANGDGGEIKTCVVVDF